MARRLAGAGSRTGGSSDAGRRAGVIGGAPMLRLPSLGELDQGMVAHLLCPFRKLRLPQRAQANP